jgi:hypothetical protein
MERAVYIQGAALLAAEDFAGCHQALRAGLHCSRTLSK